MLDMRVTLHALVRYIERVEMVCDEDVKTRLSRMASEAIPFKRGDHRWHPETGFVMVVEDDRVITILSREQSSKFRGRKLVTGERAL